MKAASITTSNVPLNTGMLLSKLGTATIAKSLASMNGSVIFGSENRLWNTYENLRKTVFKPMETAINAIVEVVDRFGSKHVQSDYITISSVDQFNVELTRPMQEAILLHEPIRELLIDNRIYGYGISADELPVEDPWKRLINNGTATMERPFLEWEFRSYDPFVTPEEILRVQDTRWFIDNHLDAEDGLDPTSYPDPIL